MVNPRAKSAFLPAAQDAPANRGKPNATVQSGCTGKIVAFAQQLHTMDLSDEVLHHAKRHFLDTCGAIVAGMQRDVAQAVQRLAKDQATPTGSRPPGSNLHLPREGFAYLAGTAAHGIELDDGYRLGSVHPGVAVVPALLATATTHPLCGQQALLAMTLGYEVICAIAQAAHPALRNRGFHPTSAIGPFGAAAAVAHVLRLDSATFNAAMGIAASSSGGLFAFLAGGGDVKRLHAGQAARGGMMAAFYANEGLSGPNDIIERDNGFSQAFAYGSQADSLQFDLPPAHEFRLLDCYIKPSACCRHLQPAAEALSQIIAEQAIQPNSIKQIEVETYSIAAAHRTTGWDSFASAQLSFPYVLGLAAYHGVIKLEYFEQETRQQPHFATFARRITISSSATMDARYPAQRPAHVRVHTDGGIFEQSADEARGCREMPLSDAALAAKFLDLTQPVLGETRAHNALKQLWELDQASNLDNLLTALAL